MDLGIIVDSLPRLLSGAWVTLQLTGISVLIGLVVAVPVALARLSANPLLRWPAFAYMFYFRGTPLLVQIFLIYYGSGQFVQQLRALGLWEFFREPYFCAVLTLTLNTAAYTAEILRGAIRAVPFGEVEAARALGMSGGLRLRRIILPKAFRLALPAYTNEVIFLFQATSLVSVITLVDLTGAARDIISDTLRLLTRCGFSRAPSTARSPTPSSGSSAVSSGIGAATCGPGPAQRARRVRPNAARLQARPSWSASRCGTSSCRR